MEKWERQERNSLPFSTPSNLFQGFFFFLLGILKHWGEKNPTAIPFFLVGIPPPPFKPVRNIWEKAWICHFQPSEKIPDTKSSLIPEPEGKKRWEKH